MTDDKKYVPVRYATGYVWLEAGQYTREDIENILICFDRQDAALKQSMEVVDTGEKQW